MTVVLRRPEMERYLGRYEFKDSASDKFWQISWEPSPSELVRAEWGKNGYPPQGTKLYSVDEAMKKLREKISKGYKRVSTEVKPYDGMTEDPEKPQTEDKEDGGFDFMTELKKIGD